MIGGWASKDFELLIRKVGDTEARAPCCRTTANIVAQQLGSVIGSLCKRVRALLHGICHRCMSTPQQSYSSACCHVTNLPASYDLPAEGTFVSITNDRCCCLQVLQYALVGTAICIQRPVCHLAQVKHLTVAAADVQLIQ